jgi:digeranylgeranylglycerophospholipid reductase
MQRHRFDVVVVGAGPAGSTAARKAAELGVEVLLLEEHPKPGLPNHCAEGLSQNGLRDAGVEPTPGIVSQRITSMRVYSPNGRFIELKSPDMVGYTINRDAFDLLLSEKAVEAGAELMTRTRALGVIRRDGVVSGILAERGGERFEVEAKVVVGADGQASVIRRSAGLGRWYPDVVSCAQFRVGDLDLEDPETNEFYIGSRYAPGGYAWIFPKSRSTANVGLGVRRGHGEPAISYLKRFMASDPRFRDSRILGLAGGITPVSGVLERIVDDGVMLVGDAAGQLIPLTGAGVHAGVVAGMMAGEVAAEAVHKGDVSASTLMLYRHRFEATWGRRIRESRRVLEMLDRFSDDDLDMLAEVITGEDIIALANGLEVARVLTKLLKRSPLKLMRLMASYIRG